MCGGFCNILYISNHNCNNLKGDQMGWFSRLTNLFNRNKVVIPLPEGDSAETSESMVLSSSNEDMSPEALVAESVEAQKEKEPDMSDVMLKVFSGEYNERLGANAQPSVAQPTAAQKEEKLKNRMEEHLLGVINRLHEKSRSNIAREPTKNLDEMIDHEDQQVVEQLSDSHDKPKMKISESIRNTPRPPKVEEPKQEQEAPKSIVLTNEIPKSTATMDALMTLDPSQIFSDDETRVQTNNMKVEEPKQVEETPVVEATTSTDPIVARLKEVYYED
mgnify:CR=1 FL=1|jgi:hypothetical protein